MAHTASSEAEPRTAQQVLTDALHRGETLRGIARKLAQASGSIESWRRDLNRYYHDGSSPTEPKAAALEAVLGEPVRRAGGRRAARSADLQAELEAVRAELAELLAWKEAEEARRRRRRRAG